ncbi:hypothetical protein TNCV_1081311 [Trichonephila clavipes]|nr:hypothetical protein TNCV_1081311 [Trichonephila clavipes]
MQSHQAPAKTKNERLRFFYERQRRTPTLVTNLYDTLSLILMGVFGDLSRVKSWGVLTRSPKQRDCLFLLEGQLPSSPPPPVAEQRCQRMSPNTPNIYRQQQWRKGEHLGPLQSSKSYSWRDEEVLRGVSCRLVDNCLLPIFSSLPPCEKSSRIAFVSKRTIGTHVSTNIHFSVPTNIWLRYTCMERNAPDCILSVEVRHSSQLQDSLFPHLDSVCKHHLATPPFHFRSTNQGLPGRKPVPSNGSPFMSTSRGMNMRTPSPRRLGISIPPPIKTTCLVVNDVAKHRLCDGPRKKWCLSELNLDRLILTALSSLSSRTYKECGRGTWGISSRHEDHAQRLP